MIELLIPSGDVNYFVEYDLLGLPIPIVMGPLQADGTAIVGSKITYDPNIGIFQQSSGMFHENNVEQVKVEGQLTLNTFIGSMVPTNPTASTPLRCTVTWRDNKKVVYDAGFLSPGMASRDGNYITGYQLSGNRAELLTIRIGKYPSVSQPWYVVTRIDHYDVTITPKSSTNWNAPAVVSWCSYTSTQGKTYEDLISISSYSEIESLWNDLNKLLSVVPSGKQSYAQNPDCRTLSAVAPLSAAYGSIDVAANRLWYKAEQPHLDNYGDLAMDASSKVNATNTNMISFIRDLRQPLSMIPKLKNLRSLRGLADNYLSVNYGILPTISDVKNILRAFQRIRPFLDRNLFQVYTSVRKKQSTVDSITSMLEQRLKLAVAKEDNAIDSLITGFERIGMLPDFKNIWDLIPYSFALDWFADVGDLLERVDTRLRLERLNIRYVTMSYRFDNFIEMYVQSGKLLSGKLHVVKYHRWVSDQCPLPPLSLQSNVTEFNHWLESAALLIQRKH